MSPSNRCYACVVCGALRRLPRPPGLVSAGEAARAQSQWLFAPGEAPPPAVALQAPYGDWRGWRVRPGFRLPTWLMHCGSPLFLLGKRAAQAAPRMTARDRLVWLQLCARVSEHAGRKRWRPVMRIDQLPQAYPLT